MQCWINNNRWYFLSATQLVLNRAVLPSFSLPGISYYATIYYKSGNYNLITFHEDKDGSKSWKCTCGIAKLLILGNNNKQITGIATSASHLVQPRRETLL
jgi:hypothetical protein